MAKSITVCNVCDLMRKTESGILDQRRLLEIVQELGEMATEHRGHNIQIDLRETQLTAGSMSDIVEAVMKAETFKELHEIKIANVVPDEASRLFIANRAEGLMQYRGFHYKVFTDPDVAIDWLTG
jgi:hypothetical protein